MKYIDEFRNQNLANQLVQNINHSALPEYQYHFMEFCGGHTHTLFRYGLLDLLPNNIHMHHGPGCPVCVLPTSRIDSAFELATKHQTILCTYGDIMRVPGSGVPGSTRKSLLDAKAEGADVRIVYSPLEAITIAKQHPERQVVFFAIGFETSTPPTAALLIEANKLYIDGLHNLSVFCNHVLTPPAIKAILHPEKTANKLVAHQPDNPVKTPELDGLIGPGHVSVITGSSCFTSLAQQFRKPIVISGFEPIDLLRSIQLLVEKANKLRKLKQADQPEKTTDIEWVTNAYPRAVTPEGNRKAQKIVQQSFQVTGQFEWRGLGWIPQSALEIHPNFSHLNAEKRFSLTPSTLPMENKACRCPEVLLGSIRPPECKLFGKSCTPENPIGACMVSSEGACAAYYLYKGQQYKDDQCKDELYEDDLHKDNLQSNLPDTATTGVVRP